MSPEILDLWFLLFIVGLAILFWVGAEVRELRKSQQEFMRISAQNPRGEKDEDC